MKQMCFLFLSAIFSVMVGIFNSFTMWELLLTSLLSFVFLMCTFTDLENRIIPNRMILYGFFGGILILLMMCAEGGLSVGGLFVRLASSVIPSFILMLLSMFTDTIGGGDAKIIGMYGLYHGEYCFLPIVFAFVLAGVLAFLAILLKKADRKTRIPMAPFFAFAFVISVIMMPYRNVNF